MQIILHKKLTTSKAPAGHAKCISNEENPAPPGPLFFPIENSLPSASYLVLLRNSVVDHINLALVVVAKGLVVLRLSLLKGLALVQ